MNTYKKETNIAKSSEGYIQKCSNKMMLLQLRRQMRLQYEIFKSGHINKKEYLATIKPLDKNISEIEMSVL